MNACQQGGAAKAAPPCLYLDGKSLFCFCKCIEKESGVVVLPNPSE